MKVYVLNCNTHEWSGAHVSNEIIGVYKTKELAEKQMSILPLYEDDYDFQNNYEFENKYTILEFEIEGK